MCLTAVGSDCPECLCENELIGAPLGTWSVSDEKTTRSQSIPMEVVWPFTAICSTRHRHGSLRTGDSSEHAIHSDAIVDEVKGRRKVNNRKNFILKIKII